MWALTTENTVRVRAETGHLRCPAVPLGWCGCYWEQPQAGLAGALPGVLPCTETPALLLTPSHPQVPCYSYGQKLSKLAILRIACNYILSLARLADLDYSADRSNLSFSECVQRCTRTLQAEGRAKKRKVCASRSGSSLWEDGTGAGTRGAPPSPLLLKGQR